MIDIQKAYSYYISNIDKTCIQKVLSFEEFQQAFPAFIDTICSPVLVFDDDTKQFIRMDSIPFLTKCNKSVMISISIINKKINNAI